MYIYIYCVLYVYIPVVRHIRFSIFSRVIFLSLLTVSFYRLSRSWAHFCPCVSPCVPQCPPVSPRVPSCPRRCWDTSPRVSQLVPACPHVSPRVPTGVGTCVPLCPPMSPRVPSCPSMFLRTFFLHSHFYWFAGMLTLEPNHFDHQDYLDGLVLCYWVKMVS